MIAQTFRPRQISDPLFDQLKAQIQQAGLDKKNPISYYMPNVALIAGMSVASLSIIAFANPFWILVVVNAVLAAIVSAQAAYLGHDAGHRQIFRKPAANNLAGLAISFFVAVVRSSWVEKHDLHHSNPNVEEDDPDLHIPLLAFSKKQAMEKRGLLRFLLPYQAFLFYPLLCLEGFGLRLASILYACRNPRELKYGWWEPLLFAAHIVLYLVVVFWFLPAWQGVAFILIHQIVFGFAMGMAFAPNHKGMAILERDNDLGFLLRQVVTARNIKRGAITDFLLGGLNYQIEHHLFPGMPRRNLGKAQEIVSAFCKEHNIPYHATSFWRAQVEILSYLHRIGQIARTNKGEAI